jgi:hypothetical protein
MKKNIIGGIYCIENVNNGLKYIGYAKDFADRWNHHQGDLKRNEHRNSYLQNIYNKYGKEIFKYYIIQELEPIEEKLRLMEIYWMTRGGEGSLGHECTEKQKEKLYTNRIGKKASEESRLKMSLFQLSRYQNEDPEERIEINKTLSKVTQGNYKKGGTSSKYVGVHLEKDYKRWISHITKDRIRYHLGTYFYEESAAFVYNQKALELFGENAKLNILPDNINMDFVLRDIEQSKLLRSINKKRKKSMSKIELSENEEISSIIPDITKEVNIG